MEDKWKERLMERKTSNCLLYSYFELYCFLAAFVIQLIEENKKLTISNALNLTVWAGLAMGKLEKIPKFDNWEGTISWYSRDVHNLSQCIDPYYLMSKSKIVKVTMA